MIQPAHHFLNVIRLQSWRQDGAVDDDHRKAQSARGDQFGLGSMAPGILANHYVDGVSLHQPRVAIGGEGSSLDHEAVMRQERSISRRIHEAQKIMMLRLRGKSIHMHAPQSQHDTARRARQDPHRRVDIAHRLPPVPGDGSPRWTGEGDMRNARLTRGDNRIGADRGGEWVSGIHQMRHFIVAQVVREAIGSAKAPYTDRHRLRLWVFDPSCIAQGRAYAALGKDRNQRACLRSTSQDKDVWNV